MDIVEIIKEKLGKYPDLSFEINENEITAFSKDKSGFDVTLWHDDREIIVFFEGWHQHFRRSNEEDALNCFAFGLSDHCRLTVFSRGGKDYRWTLHAKDSEKDEWLFEGTTVVFRFLKFWQTKTIRRLQNSVIKMDEEQTGEGEPVADLQTP